MGRQLRDRAGAGWSACPLTLTSRDPLDRSQIEFLLSLDDGQGEVLAEIVNEYLSVGNELTGASSSAQLGDG